MYFLKRPSTIFSMAIFGFPDASACIHKKKVSSQMNNELMSYYFATLLYDQYNSPPPPFVEAETTSQELYQNCVFMTSEFKVWQLWFIEKWSIRSAIKCYIKLLQDNQFIMRTGSTSTTSRKAMESTSHGHIIEKMSKRFTEELTRLFATTSGKCNIQKHQFEI